MRKNKILRNVAFRDIVVFERGEEYTDIELGIILGQSLRKAKFASSVRIEVEDKPKGEKMIEKPPENKAITTPPENKKKKKPGKSQK